MKTLVLLLGILLSTTSYAQETLKTVTDRGATSNQAITIDGYQVNSNTSKLFINNSFHNGKKWAISSGLNAITENNFGIYNWTDNVLALSISDAGNVGIGTYLPQSKFEVNGSSRFINRADFGTTFDPNTYGDVQILRDYNQPDNRFHLSFVRSGHFVYGMGFLKNSNTFGIQLQNNASNSGIFLDEFGNVGIGTSTIGSKLQVNGSSRFTHRADFGVPYDPNTYGDVQIVREPNQPDNRFHLSFVRNGQYIYGMGFLKNSNTFGIQANNTSTTSGLFLSPTGQVSIGTYDARGYTFAVAGSMIAESVKVKLESTWPDYVFDSGNKLTSLHTVEQFIKQNKHLPDIPTAAEVKEDGISLGEMNAKLLKKIEELTLYLIEQKKEIDTLKKQMAEVSRK